MKTEGIQETQESEEDPMLIANNINELNMLKL